MSDIDKAVKLARNLVTEGLPHYSDDADTLARAVLAMAPIIQAARAWRIGRNRDIIGTAPTGGQRSATGVALIDAIDTFVGGETV